MRALYLAGASGGPGASQERGNQERGNQERGQLQHSARRTELRVAPHVVFNQVNHPKRPNVGGSPMTYDSIL